MIPQGTPEATCSALWHSFASSSGVPSKPSARASATSRAALDDSPAPTGSVVVMEPSKPAAGRTWLTTPAT